MGWIWVLIASVPDLAYFILLSCDQHHVNDFFISLYLKANIPNMVKMAEKQVFCEYSLTS